jgi:hypothetical protein
MKNLFGGANLFSSNGSSSNNSVISNLGKNIRANKSDDFMIIFFVAIIVLFAIFLLYRFIQYRKIVCEPGMKKSPFFVFSITGEKCIPSVLKINETKVAVSTKTDEKRIPSHGYELIPGTLSNIKIDKPITPTNVNDEVPLPTGTSKEVFHIANQDYTYEQARCKCASYGARLATYEEIVEAYNKGGDWCSYGWTEGQRAYYPTQKCSWDKLQTGPKEMRNMCGLPGVNGGFFPNPNMKFGATCFGVKPEGKVVKPKVSTCATGVCERPGNSDASTRKRTDVISPFNNDKWNE